MYLYCICFPETTNDENLPETSYEDISLSKLKCSVSKNDGSPLKSTNFPNNFVKSPQIVEETYIGEQSLKSYDVVTQKSDHNNDVRMNKENNSSDRPISTKSSFEGIFIGHFCGDI